MVLGQGSPASGTDEWPKAISDRCNVQLLGSYAVSTPTLEIIPCRRVIPCRTTTSSNMRFANRIVLLLVQLVVGRRHRRRCSRVE